MFTLKVDQDVATIQPPKVMTTQAVDQFLLSMKEWVKGSQKAFILECEGVNSFSDSLYDAFDIFKQSIEQVKKHFFLFNVSSNLLQEIQQKQKTTILSPVKDIVATLRYLKLKIPTFLLAKDERTFDKNAHILVVDSIDGVRKVTVGLLKKLEYTHIDSVPDARQAFEKLKNLSYRCDLVICENNLTEISGIDFLKSVRAISKLNRLPFLMMALNPDGQLVREALRNKVSEIIVKPFKEPELKAKMKKIYQKHFV